MYFFFPSLPRLDWRFTQAPNMLRKGWKDLIWKIQNTFMVNIVFFWFRNASDHVSHRVAFGMVSVADDADTRIVLTPQSIKVHPDFDDVYLNWDIAILGILSEIFSFLSMKNMCLLFIYLNIHYYILIIWSFSSVSCCLVDHLIVPVAVLLIILDVSGAVLLIIS